MRNARPSWPRCTSRSWRWPARTAARRWPSPVWYDYHPGGEVRLITERDSRKTALFRRAGRITLCVQGTALPYQYASAEGPITAIEDTVTVEQRRALASRYLGPEGADAYIESTPGATERMVRILMRPEHWLTRDYTKLSS